MRGAAAEKISRTSFGERIWPLLKREAETIVRAAGAITVVLWFKRVVEQLLGAKILNESILRGHWNDFIRGHAIEADIRSRE